MRGAATTPRTIPCAPVRAEPRPSRGDDGVRIALDGDAVAVAARFDLKQHDRKFAKDGANAWLRSVIVELFAD